MPTGSILQQSQILAQQRAEPPWFLFPLIGLVGLIVLAAGIYAITTKRVLLRGKNKLALRLFGVTEITGRWAVIVGVGQCLVGVGTLLVAITGPFWAGMLADQPAPHPEKQMAEASPEQIAANNHAQAAPDPGQIASDAVGQTATDNSGQAPTNSAPIEPVTPDTQPDVNADPRIGWRLGNEGGGQAFSDEAPAGGLLVGLRCVKGLPWEGAIQAVQAIYQIGPNYVLGERHGHEGGEEYLLIAKPGYAVGAIHAHTSIALETVRVVFYRIQDDKLDPTDKYTSQWVGADNEGGPSVFDAQGQPIVGIFGAYRDALVSLGVTPIEKLAAAIPLASDEPPDPWDEPRTGRILGVDQGTEFEDRAPDGGILVGVRASCDPELYMAIRSLQAIYLVGDRYVEGQRHGEGGSIEVLTVARPGFCVAGIAQEDSGIANGFRLRYCQITPQGPTDDGAYLSNWLGFEFREFDQEARIGQLFAVGIAGRIHKGVSALGLIVAGPRSVNLVNEPALPIEYRQAALASTRLRAGDPDGKAFEDSAPNGGLLVGLRLAKGENYGGALQAVQPIYEVKNGDALGTRCGTTGGAETELRAKPGYAVGALRVRRGLVVNAIQIVFYRIDGTRLNAGESETSEWIGSDGGEWFSLNPAGDPITGIFGTFDKDLTSLGIQPVQRLWEEQPLAEAVSVEPPGDDSAPVFRTWTSADGNSTVEAICVGFENDAVTLQRRDGKNVTVPLSKLSPADIEFVRQKAQ